MYVFVINSTFFFRNEELEKRLALEISKITAKKSNPHFSRLSPEQQQLTPHQLALAVQAATAVQTSLNPTNTVSLFHFGGS